MGVKGLWKILENQGEVISLEEIRGQKVAVDISIWLNQFSKAHSETNNKFIIECVFRRICKLLF